MGLIDEYFTNRSRNRALQGLLGDRVTTTGSMRSANIEYDEDGNEIPVDEYTIMQQPRSEYSGFLGSNNQAGDIAAANAGLLTSGFNPSEASSILSPFKEQNTNALAAQKAAFDRTNKLQEQSFDQGNVLRKERSSKLASFNEAKTQYDTTMNALQQDSGAGSLAAIFSFMKTLDPRSVVREGEFDMATKTGGVVDSLVGMVNGLKGKAMGPNARLGIAEAINAIMQGRVGDAERIAAQFDTIAGEQNIPLSQIRTGEFNPELQAIPQSFYDANKRALGKGNNGGKPASGDRYEYRIDPKTGKQQRKRVG